MKKKDFKEQELYTLVYQQEGFQTGFYASIATEQGERVLPFFKSKELAQWVAQKEGLQDPTLSVGTLPAPKAQSLLQYLDYQQDWPLASMKISYKVDNLLIKSLPPMKCGKSSIPISPLYLLTKNLTPQGSNKTVWLL
ncbi:hypothetical protein [Heliorestis convoluta]|uniref:hypothetical protein n=1 Tax=Heliorestis convoluta TaxID=356322 RepID=UPI00129BDD73|nr:hypothetical protein [Heliorestis convoluta]